jgi:large subunit ribosomal protein L13|tara:strand:- start:776 stop:1183 length:408 start_codon:yes stop_codon:yes gene_type:complete
MIVIDATNQIVGRMASFVAKTALLGEKIVVVNCENAIISGNKSSIIAKYKMRREIGGPMTGPFFPRQPDRVVRRTIRGMLSYKQGRGRDAFKNIMCYLGVPEKYEKEKLITSNKTDVSKLPNYKYMILKDLCKLV